MNIRCTSTSDVPNEGHGGRLWRVTPSGDATVLFDALGGIIDLAIEATGDIVVAQEAGNVFRIARDWSGSVPLGDGFGTLEGIAVTPLGDILVAGFSSGQLWRLPADGGAPTLLFSGLASPDHLVVRILN